MSSLGISPAVPLDTRDGMMKGGRVEVCAARYLLSVGANIQEPRPQDSKGKENRDDAGADGDRYLHKATSPALYPR